MMKKSVLFFTALNLSLSLTGCFFKGDDAIAEETTKKMVKYIKEKDAEGIKGLFAENVVNSFDDFDQKVTNLLSYISGDFVSVEYLVSAGAEKDLSYGSLIWSFLNYGPTKIYTTKGGFYLSFYQCSYYRKDLDNEGIWNLMVDDITEEDPEDQSFSSYDEWCNGTTYRGITFW